MDISISVIIPAYNIVDYIDKAITSVLKQSYSHFELIIINDGSSDNTLDKLTNYASIDPRIVLVDQTNQGPSAARNHGLRIARGNLIFFLDGDDWIHRQALDDLVKEYKKHKYDILVYPATKYFESSDNWASGTDDWYWQSESLSSSRTRRAVDLPELLAVYPLVSGKVFSREFLLNNDLRFINGIRYEDNPFHVSVLAKNPKVSVTNNRYYAWRQERPGQTTGTAHSNDALVILRVLTSTTVWPNPRSFVFFLVTIVRLIAAVAQKIASNQERLKFVQASRKITDCAFEVVFHDNSLNKQILDTRLHPADLMLLSSYFSSSYRFSNLMGVGVSRYLAFLTAVLFWKNTNFLQKICKSTKLLSHPLMLKNFSNGVGETRIVEREHLTVGCESVNEGAS